MRSILPFLALLPALVAGPVAASSSYDVEIVVFEHLDSGSSETERWPPEVVIPRIAEATAFERSGPRAERLRELPAGFERLPRERTTLGGAVARLDEHDDYRILRHAIWRQPALGADEAVALRFDAGEPVTVRVPAASYPAAPEDRDRSDRPVGVDEVATGSEDEPALGGNYMPETPFGRGMLAPPMQEAGVAPLDGTVKLVVSRYLHLHADLYYTTPVEWTDAGAARANGAHTAAAVRTAGSPRTARRPDGQAMLSYRFRQERRMRSGELHYLDHPVLGILVLVTPGDDGSAASAGG